MTRKEFLKKATLGAIGLALFSKFGAGAAEAATVSDNLGKGGHHKGASAPTNKKMLWIDTNNDGVMKYWNGSAWTPIRSTWDE